MVRFLIQRPIAVTMAFLASLVLGVVAIFNIPVSLMPDIDVPEITVQINRKNSSAREIENTLLSPLRRQLVQVAHIDDMNSQARDERGTIHLKFDYGTDIDLAFIEVNEKIDRAMGNFPREIERPKIVKASATDIPVFYLNLTLKKQLVPGKTEASPPATGFMNSGRQNLLFPVPQKFIELSDFSTRVIKPRLEQLPDIAMVDMSGLVFSELLVIPDIKKLQALHITIDQLEVIIQNSNVNLGNLIVQDGQYQYNIRFNSVLTSKQDISDIPLRVQDRLFQLKDVAEIIEHPQQRRGMVAYNGQPAITLAIIKQSDVQMGDLKENLYALINHFHQDYPDIDFAIERDQTQLLDYSISNLNQDLIWGGVLALLIMFLFLKDYKSPLLIGVTLPASLIVSLLFFYALHISINIISLSGLVLGIGMMIDNSIIVIDNIVQYRERNWSLLEACVKGANEVFVPMLSSSLTTCAVFIPLIFMSGIAGALFYDEAMSVVIGALVSLVISVTLIPVYYHLFYRNGKAYTIAWLGKINTLNYESLYEKSFKYVMRRQKTTWAVVLMMIPLGFYLYTDLPKSKLPPITKEDMIWEVDWNERINIEENNTRLQTLLDQLNAEISSSICWIGEQQFLLHNNANLGASEASVYIKSASPESLDDLPARVTALLNKAYPRAVVRFTEANNIFNFMFSDNEAPLTARLRYAEEPGPERNHILQKTLTKIQNDLPHHHIQAASFEEHMVLKIDPARLIAYGISHDVLYNKLKSAFNAREIFLIIDNQAFVPVIMGERPQLFSEILSGAFVPNRDGREYPINELISEARAYDLKSIEAGQEGEYFPVHLNVKDTEAPAVTEAIKRSLAEEQLVDVGFTGSVFSNQQLISQLSIILVISVILLYFILAAQFESLTLPLIVLIEIPIDIFAAFLFLKLFNAGINLMSLIGMVVMGGIIINDSILKIDTINQLSKEGNSLIKSILLGGRRRLKPILMTSLTTILAMVPMLLTPGLSSELQKPLAVALLGGMTVGTLVSVYFIPLCYYYLMRGKTRKVL
jgi:multidrug efflux pump subunit AcrB